MKICLIDDLPPETTAMLQALYSRSSKSVSEHLQRVRKTGSDKFMSSYYVGYGHASIGDCGVTSLYLEDISLLACKAVQDNPLYSGQESSTRYIDFSTQRVHNPEGTPLGERILQRWLEFYSSASSELLSHLRAKFPCPDAAMEKTWEKAIDARVFDVMRGFLPAGVSSQVSWTTNLRQAHEHTLRLMHHPLSEVRRLGEAIRNGLCEKYPHSFLHRTSAEELEYLKRVSASETYNSDHWLGGREDVFEVRLDFDPEELQGMSQDLLRDRPRRSILPRNLGRYGHFHCRFLLDFGSFRDLQRHRAGICRMPLLSSEHGFHSWYFLQMPDQLAKAAKELVADQLTDVARLRRDGLDAVDIQYFLPLGMNVVCDLAYDLPEMMYVAELRSGQTVHPTLRAVAQRMAKTIRTHFPYASIHADFEESQFSIRRGRQDIVERE